MLKLTLLTVFLLVGQTHNERVWSTPWKSFRRVTNPNGVNLCPSGENDKPYDTIAVDKLQLPQINTACPPPFSLCSWKCTMEPNCTSFSWKANTNQCEFYTCGDGRTCTIVNDCIYFESKICGQPSCGTEGVALSITADNEVKQLYIDDLLVTNLPNAKDWRKTDIVFLPNGVTSLIAVEIHNDPGEVSGLLASSNTIRTDGTWKVTTKYTSGWMNMTFDDSTWNNATTYGYNGVEPWKTRPGISDSAQWISTENIYDTTVYFRYHLKHGDDRGKFNEFLPVAP